MLCQRQLFELGHPTQYNGKNNSFLFEKLFYSCLGKFRGTCVDLPASSLSKQAFCSQRRLQMIKTREEWCWSSHPALHRHEFTREAATQLPQTLVKTFDLSLKELFSGYLKVCGLFPCVEKSNAEEHTPTQRTVSTKLCLSETPLKKINIHPLWR